MPPNGSQSLQETAAAGVEAIHKIVQERDKLIAESSRLRTDLAMTTEKAAQLAGRLEQTTAERDHYMRFATELVTQLNTIRMVIDEAARNAKLVAFKPGPVAKPNTNVVDLVDTKSLEGLLERLPRNGGENAAAAGK